MDDSREPHYDEALRVVIQEFKEQGPMRKKELKDEVSLGGFTLYKVLHGGPFVKDDSGRWHLKHLDE